MFCSYFLYVLLIFTILFFLSSYFNFFHQTFYIYIFNEIFFVEKFSLTVFLTQKKNEKHLEKWMIGRYARNNLVGDSSQLIKQSKINVNLIEH